MKQLNARRRGAHRWALEALESRLTLSATMAALPLPPPILSHTTQISAPANAGVLRAAALAALGGAAATAVNGQTSIAVGSYSAISNCSLETQSGQTQSDIGYVSASGAYVEYTLTAAVAGDYTLTLGLASYTGAQVQTLIDGIVQGTAQAKATFSWSNYVNGSALIHLNAGTNTLRLASQNATQYNLNALTLSPVQSVVTSTNMPTPVSLSNANPMTGIGDNTSIAIASYSGIWDSRLEFQNLVPDIGYVSANGAYVEYTLDVATSGNYALNIVEAAPTAASFDVSDNGTKIGSFGTAATGGWGAFTTASQMVYLNAGQQTLRFTATNSSQYNLGAIQLVRQIGSTTTGTGGATASAPVSITQRWLTSLNEIDIVGTSFNDSIYVSQAGAILTIDANGLSQQLPANGELAIWGGDGDDTITVDASVTLGARIYGGNGNNVLTDLTRGQATIVSIGGGHDDLTGNGINTSFWADSGDTVHATPAENALGAVHVVTGFYQPYTTVSTAPGYVPLTLNGPNLTDPASAGSGTTRLGTSSFFGLGPVQEDINQGQSSDCYLLTTLQSLARLQPGALREMAVDLGDGTYAVAFHRGGQTQYVRVDGDLPTASWGGLLYNRPGASGNQWASIIEKAYAFYRFGSNSYASLDFGFMTPVYNDLGVSALTFTLSADQNAFYALASAKLAAGKAVDICTNLAIINAPLIASHTYSIVNTWRDSAGTVWITLRNPWGIDGFNVDSNPSDGMLTMTYASLQANSTSGTVMA